MPRQKASERRRRTRVADSVYFDKTKERWVARIVVGVYENGSPKRTRRFFQTKREAEVALTQLHLDHKTGRLQPTGTVTLGEWLDQWLESYRSKGAPSTEDFYRGVVRNHVKPHLGHRPLAKVQAGEIEALYRKMEAQGLRRYPSSAHQTLKTAFRKARQLGLIAVDPMERVQAPRKPDREEQFLTLEQVVRFLKATEDQPDEVQVLAKVGIMTGLRLAELTGLRWADIDLDQALLTVCFQLRTRGEKTLARLKTSKSARTLALPGAAVEALRSEKARQTINAFENPMGLALLNSVGTPWHQKNANEKLKAVCRSAQVGELSAHRLFRHSFATLMLKQGVSLHDVSRMLGHSSTALTANLYGHHEIEATRRAASTLERAIKSKS